MEDLIQRNIPLDEKEMLAEELWENCYKNNITFIDEDVEFEQFKERLQDHRKKLNSNILRAAEDAIAVQHSREMFPRQERNKRGELVFDMHRAKQLLRADVKEEKHNNKTPRELQATRDEYKAFKPEIFKDRIAQEVRY